MDHDELLERAAQELATVLQQIEQRGTCPVCVAALLVMVVDGLERDGDELEADMDQWSH